MPRYFFHLNTGDKIIPDPEGTELPDHDSARAHARQVVRELARNRERMTGSWRLAVCGEDGTPCFELLFASIDESGPGSRTVVQFLLDEVGTASEDDTISEVRKRLLQVGRTLAPL